jgi:hypothetical protein
MSGRGKRRCSAASQHRLCAALHNSIIEEPRERGPALDAKIGGAEVSSRPSRPGSLAIGRRSGWLMISQIKPGFEIRGRNQLLLHGHASANAYIAKSTIGSCKRSG